MPRPPKSPRSHTIIYATDIKKMMGRGRSLRTAYRILQKIRQHYDKLPKSDVTVEEYCKYMKCKINEIQPIIDAIRREEDMAIYSAMKNPPRNVLADIDLPNWDIHLN